MTTGTCKTCQHWEAIVPTALDAVAKLPRGCGLCTRLSAFEKDEEATLEPGAALIVPYVAWTPAYFITDKGFSCALHTEKGTPTL